MATEIQKALEATTTEFKELLETQSQEIKQFGETSKETAQKIAALEKSMQGMAEDSKERELKMQERIDELEAAGKRIGAGGPAGIKQIEQALSRGTATPEQIEALVQALEDLKKSISPEQDKEPSIDLSALDDLRAAVKSHKSRYNRQ